MGKLLFYRLLCLLACAWPAGLAHAQKIGFSRYSIDEGLSEATVNCMGQDALGLLWFGTRDGLNLFDGYHFQVFREQGGLRHSDITAWASGPDGEVWVGTFKGGLHRFDRGANAFLHEPMPSDSITALAFDAQGRLWAGSKQGLFLRTPDGFRQVLLQGDRSRGITCLLPAAQGGVWAGTKQGFFGVEDEERAIHCDPEPGLPDDAWAVSALHADAQGRLWVGTEAGLFLLQDGRRTYGAVPQEGLHSLPPIRALATDAKGWLWAGTVNGLFAQPPGPAKAQVFYHDDNDIRSLSESGISSLLVDAGGVLWVGTRGGGINAFKHPDKAFLHYYRKEYEENTLVHNDIRGFSEDPSGNIWIATDGGLACFDPETGQFERWMHDPARSNTISGNRLRAVYADASGNVWIGTRNAGLSCLLPDRRTVLRFPPRPELPDGLAHGSVWAIAQTPDGLLWLGTGNGLARFDPEANRFQTFRHSPDDPHSIGGNDVNCLLVDREGNVWAGTYGDGLSVWMAQEGRFRRYRHREGEPGSLSHNHVNAVFQDRQGRIWVGTHHGGLNLLEADGQFRHYSEADGLPNDVVYGIREDREGHIWVSTNKGLAKLDPETGAFRHYTSRDGLQGNEFGYGAHYADRAGRLYFGGIKGFNVFFPEQIKDNPYRPPVLLRDFKVYNKSVPIAPGNPDAPLQRHISVTDTIVLSYQDAFFSFEFAALNYDQQDKNRYAYQLVGLDPEWNEVGSQRLAYYTSVPSGRTYTFRVKAANNDGLWNEEGAQVTIIITPPIWETGWFRIASTVAFLGLLLGIYKWRVRQIERQKRKLEQQVRERTAEIQKQAEEIQVQNEELTQQAEEISTQRDHIAAQHRQLEGSFHNIRILGEIGNHITSILNTEALIDTVYHEINQLLDAAGFGIALYSPERQALVFKGFIEKGEVLPDSADSLQDAHLYSVQCFLQQQLLHVPDLHSTMSIEQADRSGQVGEIPHSLVYLPLTVEGNRIGVLTVQSFKANAYTDTDLSMLRTLASYIAVAVANAEAYALINEKNEKITDSIRYAQTIQQAILPLAKRMQRHLPEHFVLYRPKDIVSGDFYWFLQVKGNDAHPAYTFVAVVDCTGHGVPGAFMSMIGSRLLSEIVGERDVFEPGAVLELLDEGLRKALKQGKAGNSDGMDVCLCRFDPGTEAGLPLRFAGAHRPLFVWRQNDGQLQAVKGNKRSIGGASWSADAQGFAEEEVLLQPGDMLYLTTDGLPDQNDPQRRKFGTGPLLQLLQAMGPLPADEQLRRLEEALAKHQGQAEQRDDITVMGIRV